MSKVRADIAALIREGHSNTSIAHRLGCDDATVARARKALRLPAADQLGRLYAEALPTGRVLSDKPARVPTSPERAAANRKALLAALREPRVSTPAAA
jgi:transposase-like protein